MGQKFRRNRSISHGLGDTSNFKFTIFVKNSKIQNGRHFWKEETFLRIEQSILHMYPAGQKFRRNHSISHGLGDTSNFKFYHFCQKFENSKWPPFQFLRIEQSILHIYPVGQKFRRNRSISHGLGDTSNFKFTIFVKNSKIQNGRHFWKEETFLRIEQSILYMHPAGQKFRRNHSISHGLGDTSNFKFYQFCQKLQNSKWPPILERGNFFEIEQST